MSDDKQVEGKVFFNYEDGTWGYADEGKASGIFVRPRPGEPLAEIAERLEGNGITLALLEEAFDAKGKAATAAKAAAPASDPVDPVAKGVHKAKRKAGK